ncbi:MAG: type II toxin-antitoxin system VapC family toxin [Chloroflexota bacterium]
MRALLDTHSFLWFIAGDEKLSEHAKLLIEDEETELLMSIASVWEMAIKTSLGKLTLAQPFDELPTHIEQNKIKILPIKVEHTILVAKLPFHHRDPFDRLIIAQALVEHLPIIGIDAMFDAYGIKRLW